MQAGHADRAWSIIIGLQCIADKQRLVRRALELLASGTVDAGIRLDRSHFKASSISVQPKRQQLENRDGIGSRQIGAHADFDAGLA